MNTTIYLIRHSEPLKKIRVMLMLRINTIRKKQNNLLFYCNLKT